MREKIIHAARSYIGVPWKHQGRSIHGLDCAGLVVRVAHDLELSAFDTSDYGRDPLGGRLQLILEQEAVRNDQYQLGSILLMRFKDEPQHLAIVSDYGIIHAHAAVRKVVEHRLDDLWRSRIVAAYDFPGVA